MKYTFMENFKDKDPEFYDFYSHFIGEEVINDTTLDDKSRYLSITAVLVGTKAHDLFKDMLDDLLKYLTVDEIQDILGISQPTAYALIKKNLFHSIRIGRNIRVSKASFDAWLDNQG